MGGKADGGQRQRDHKGDDEVDGDDKHKNEEREQQLWTGSKIPVQ